MNQNKLIRKQLRRKINAVGWAMVIYYLIMNVAVIGVMLLEAIIAGVVAALENPELLENEAALESFLMENLNPTGVLGYFVAIAVGLMVLLLWKKKRFWKEQIWAKGSPMKVGSFFGILAVFLAVQFVTTILNMVLETLLNSFGLSMMSIVESTGGSSESFGMFLYGCVAAPIVEEILFRGFVQRSLQPYGKQFAIFCSALLFGLFHGNLIQTPFAFMVGLVLGYVTMEYGIGWAMVLHMINNMVLADMLTRLTSGLGEMGSSLIFLGVIFGSAVAALVVMIVNRRKIAAYLRRDKIHKLCMQAFISSPSIIIFTVMMLVNLVLLITPL